MTSAELLVDGFGRIRETVTDVLSGLTSDQLAYRLDADANPISWLVWHLTRVQDDHVAKAFGAVQVWSSGGWAKRFGLAEGTMETGYGHTTTQVGAVGSATAAAPLLVGYHEATYAQTARLVSAVTDADLNRVVDPRWTPPVTLGVRLVSVLNDDMMHVGQATYAHGIILRSGIP
jgi:DinB superfamily